MDVRSANAAHWRAMSPARLLDCGMSYADVVELQRRTGADEPWDSACEQIGRRRLEEATVARTAGHRVTARHRFGGAAASFLFAQMAFNHDGPRKAALYERFDDAVALLGQVSESPVERLELPFEAGALCGWYLAPAGRAVGTVIVFGGQSGWGAAYLRHAAALGARGIATVLAEGPGQGSSRLRHGVHLDVDVPSAFRVFVDEAMRRHHAPVGIWGNSVGGLFAALTAASDSRIRACCVNGGFAAPRLLPFRTFAEQAGAMLGTDDADAIEDNFARLRFDPATHRISGSLLVLHGGADPLVDLSDQQPFLEAADDATLRVWDDGDHTVYNHGDERNDEVADWFADRFREGRER
ncbi:dipeptidyl aminopeptidase [Gordonia sihwensis]|nr:dipeptidyl aminopeptidase [Gordonia sihwensis]